MRPHLHWLRRRCTATASADLPQIRRRHHDPEFSRYRTVNVPAHWPMIASPTFMLSSTIPTIHFTVPSRGPGHLASGLLCRFAHQSPRRGCRTRVRSLGRWPLTIASRAPARSRSTIGDSSIAEEPMAQGSDRCLGAGQGDYPEPCV
jgi:hypothetical protein